MSTTTIILIILLWLALLVLYFLYMKNMDKKVMTLVNTGVGLSQKGEYEKALEVFNKVIKDYSKLQDKSIQEIVIAAFINKATILSQLNDVNQAMQTYDEVIKTYENSKEDKIHEQIAVALYNKATIQAQCKNYESSLGIFDILIQTYKISDDEGILNQVKSAIVNKSSVSLISNQSINQEDVNLLKSLVKEDTNKLMILDMLLLLQEAKEKVLDEEVSNFKEKYAKVSFGLYSFEEITSWAKNFEDEEVKDRLLRYTVDFQTKTNA